MNDLLAQRKEIKRLERERDAEEKEREQGEGRLMEEARERELREFEMVSMGLEERDRKRKIGEDEGGGDEADEVEKLRAKRRKGFELDEKELERVARSERDKVRRKMEEEKVQPSNTHCLSSWDLCGSQIYDCVKLMLTSISGAIVEIPTPILLDPVPNSFDSRWKASFQTRKAGTHMSSILPFQ